MASLTYKHRQFLLNGSPFQILSGAIHYFRVVPQYWSDRLSKAKACGLNTVETYVPWNLHEPRPGLFKSEGSLDLRAFLKLAHDLDLKVILRPGPYICSEWDFGGLPSWLLADPHMAVRSTYEPYQQSADRYLTWLLGDVKDLQYCQGGPIIAVQVENEYGSFSLDIGHLDHIKDTIVQCGITEMLITSDNSHGVTPPVFLDGVLPTANFQTVDEGKLVFDVIKKHDPDFPLMAMEFWSGWFDHWGLSHEERSVQQLEESLRFVLGQNGSVNFYMFHGGTNFGLMAGANQSPSSYKPDVTSYDYNAPLTEDGRPTDKFYKIRQIIKQYSTKNEHSSTIVSEILKSPARIAQRIELKVQNRLPWGKLIDCVTKRLTVSTPKTMEMYSFPVGDIQSYGYIIYRTSVNKADMNSEMELKLPDTVKDRVIIVVDGNVKDVLDWKSKKRSVMISTTTSATNDDGNDITTSYVIVDIVVENLGRVNYTERDEQEVLNTQRKGMEGDVSLAGKVIQDWTVIALDFTHSEDFIINVRKSNRWQNLGQEDDHQHQQSTIEIGTNSPALYKSVFDLSDFGNQIPSDCFVKLDGFTKGLVFVNGVNLGRYWSIGPQRTLYLPGPFLKENQNEIMIFEEHKAARSLSLETDPQLG